MVRTSNVPLRAADAVLNRDAAARLRTEEEDLMMKEGECEGFGRMLLSCA